MRSFKLFFSAQPLKNSSDTIVVVGGVHWLATSHLHTLMNILKRSVFVVVLIFFITPTCVKFSGKDWRGPKL
jgi:hypothetical protein